MPRIVRTPKIGIRVSTFSSSFKEKNSATPSTIVKTSGEPKAFDLAVHQRFVKNIFSLREKTVIPASHTEQ